jgi:broad specificity phosphatase PhoE
MTANVETPTASDNCSVAAHNAAALETATKDSAEHMEGMSEVYQEMRQRPLIVKAYSLDEGPSGSNSNVKTVHFARHGQGFHNLMGDVAMEQGRKWVNNVFSPENPYTMPEILDAPLTEKGRQQALLLQPIVRAFPNQPELVVLSPNCRALQTGLIVFEHLLADHTTKQPGVPFLAHEMVREEFGVHICDKRRPTSRQKQEFPQVDFSLLSDDEDPLFRDTVRESKLEVGERIYRFFEWLSERPEQHVGVASHSAWLLTVFNGVCECDDKLKAWFQTGEMRSVKLEFVKDDMP